jgi:FtsZ-interacting cell division protein ZipA
LLAETPVAVQWILLIAIFVVNVIFFGFWIKNLLLDYKSQFKDMKEKKKKKKEEDAAKLEQAKLVKSPVIPSDKDEKTKEHEHEHEHEQIIDADQRDDKFTDKMPTEKDVAVSMVDIDVAKDYENHQLDDHPEEQHLQEKPVRDSPFSGGNNNLMNSGPLLSLYSPQNSGTPYNAGRSPSQFAHQERKQTANDGDDDEVLAD